MRPTYMWLLIVVAVAITAAAIASGEHIRWSVGLVLILAAAVIGRAIGQWRERKQPNA